MSALVPRVSGPGGFLFAIAAYGLQPTFAHSVLARTSRIEPIATYVFVASQKPEAAIGVQEIIRSLRDGGMPVAAIAEMARVERKTVYAWLEGGNARSDRESRLAEIHGLLLTAGMDFHALWRVSARVLSSGTTLRQLLGAEMVEGPAVRAALDELRPVVERQSRRAAARIPSTSGASNPVLDEMPAVDLI